MHPFWFINSDPLPPCCSVTPYDFLGVALTLPASAHFITIISPAANGILSSGYAFGPMPISSPSSWTAVLHDLGDLAWPLFHLDLATPRLGFWKHCSLAWCWQLVMVVIKHATVIPWWLLHG